MGAQDFLRYRRVVGCMALAGLSACATDRHESTPPSFRCEAKAARYRSMTRTVSAGDIIEGSVTLDRVTPRDGWAGMAAIDLIRTGGADDFARLLLVVKSPDPASRIVDVVSFDTGKADSTKLKTISLGTEVRFRIEFDPTGSTLTRLDGAPLSVRMTTVPVGSIRAACSSGRGVFRGIGPLS